MLTRLVADGPLIQIKIHDVRRFIAQLHGKGLSAKSLARVLSAWRGFFKFLIRVHGFSDNPCVGLRPPRGAKPLPETLSPDEAARLMEIQGDSALVLRDRAILELFYSSGLRLAELTALDPSGIDFVDGTVRVTGKGNKTRIVPVGKFALDAIKAWMEKRSEIIRPEETALFVGRSGKRLTPRAVQLRMEGWARKLGLERHVHPHVLRHSFASHVLQSSGDLRAVQEMLGHASISTTQIYTHLDYQYLAKVYDQAHPRAKRK